MKKSLFLIALLASTNAFSSDNPLGERTPQYWDQRLKNQDPPMSAKEYQCASMVYEKITQPPNYRKSLHCIEECLRIFPEKSMLIPYLQYGHCICKKLSRECEKVEEKELYYHKSFDYLDKYIQEEKQQGKEISLPECEDLYKYYSRLYLANPRKESFEKYISSLEKYVLSFDQYERMAGEKFNLEIYESAFSIFVEQIPISVFVEQILFSQSLEQSEIFL